MQEATTKYPPAPSDADAARAWDEIMRIARDHCLIIAAYGGVATLATPEAQRTTQIRAGVLRAHARSEAEEVANGH